MKLETIAQTKIIVVLTSRSRSRNSCCSWFCALLQHDSGLSCFNYTVYIELFIGQPVPNQYEWRLYSLIAVPFKLLLLALKFASYRFSYEIYPLSDMSEFSDDVFLVVRLIDINNC